MFAVGRIPLEVSLTSYVLANSFLVEGIDIEAQSEEQNLKRTKKAWNNYDEILLLTRYFSLQLKLWSSSVCLEGKVTGKVKSFDVAVYRW